MKIIHIVHGILFYVSVMAIASSLYGSENNRKGFEAMQQGRFDEAISYLTEVHRENSNDPLAKNNLSIAYNNAAIDCDKKGDFNKAIDYIKKAYNLEPDLPIIKKNFANILMNESVQRYNKRSGEDIVGLLKEAIIYDDTLIQAHVLLGQAYYEQDNYFLAQDEWKIALRMNPSLSDVQKKMDKLNKEMTNDSKLQNQEKFHFKVRYEGMELRDASRDVLDILENAYSEAGRKLTEYPNKPLTVIIYTQEQFQSVSGLTDSFAGAYDGKIRIRRSDVQGDKKKLQQILYHEYMHAIVHYLSGNNVPVWLNEGIAQCYENMPEKAELYLTEKQIIKQRMEKDVPNPAQIDMLFNPRNSQTDIQFAYAYSKSFVSYLISYGWDYKIKNLLDALGKGFSVDDAFNKTYFKNLKTLMDDWLSKEEIIR